MSAIDEKKEKRKKTKVSKDKIILTTPLEKELMKKVNEYKVLFDKMKSNVEIIQKMLEEKEKVCNDTKKLYEELLEKFEKRDADIKKCGYDGGSTLFTTNNSITKNKNILDKELITISKSKMEEFESSYSEMSKNFNLLTIKYKLIKDECVDEENKVKQVREEIKQIKNINKEIEKQINEYILINNRLKEINRCLIEDNKNNYQEIGGFGNINNNSNNIILSEELEEKNAGTHIEPMPSFLKFLED